MDCAASLLLIPCCVCQVCLYACRIGANVFNVPEEIIIREKPHTCIFIFQGMFSILRQKWLWKSAEKGVKASCIHFMSVSGQTFISSMGCCWLNHLILKKNCAYIISLDVFVSDKKADKYFMTNGFSNLFLHLHYAWKFLSLSLSHSTTLKCSEGNKSCWGDASSF